MRRAHADVIGKRCLVAVVVSLVLFGAVAPGARSGQGRACAGPRAVDRRREDDADPG